jgi:mannose-1-phosphate guanylyltransferase/phosphomannomutase
VRIFAYAGGVYWLDIGTAAKYLKAHRDILDNAIEMGLSGRQLSRGITVGEGCQLLGELRPPVLLGRNCVVERRAIVGPYAVLGDSVAVEEGAIVQHSVLWRGCSVKKGSLVYGSVVGFETKIPTGFQLVDAAVGEKGHGLPSPRAQAEGEV